MAMEIHRTREEDIVEDKDLDCRRKRRTKEGRRDNYVSYPTTAKRRTKHTVEHIPTDDDVDNDALFFGEIHRTREEDIVEDKDLDCRRKRRTKEGRRDNYVSYPTTAKRRTKHTVEHIPTDDDVDNDALFFGEIHRTLEEDIVEDKDLDCRRKTRTKEGRRDNYVSYPTTDKRRTKHTVEHYPTDDDVDNDAIKISQALKFKPSRKGKVIHSNKINIVNVTQKKSHKKKTSKKNSNTSLKENVSQKSLNCSNSSLDSLHSAAGCPNNNVKDLCTKSKPKKINSTLSKSPRAKDISHQLNTTFETVSDTLANGSNSGLKKRSKSMSCIKDEGYKRDVNVCVKDTSVKLIDKDDEPKCLDTTFDSKLSTENIFNSTPVLIESSMVDSKVIPSPSTKPVNKSISKCEDAFTKDGMDPIIITKKKMSVVDIVKTPTKARISLPSPRSTPFDSSTKTLQRQKRSLGELARITKVMFCSPVDNPVMNTQRNNNIKSSMKGSNKSFVLEEKSAKKPASLRKRTLSQTETGGGAGAGEATVGARAKRSRLADGLQHSVDRLSHPRTSSAQEPETATKETDRKSQPLSLIKTDGKKTYTRFGFNLEVKPFSNPSKIPVKENGGVVVNEIKKVQPLINAVRKDEAKQMIMRKKPATTVLIENRNIKMDENRSEIKGVRSNRRFELLMKARNINS